MKTRKAIPKQSPKRLKEIAEGTRYRDGTLKVKPKKENFAWPTAMADILKANKGITTANKLVGKPKIRKKIAARSKNNKGGQVALFKRIWDEREHKCEVCGAPIEEATASNFSHLLPKGTYPDYKLDERNVEIWCAPCHDLWHQQATVKAPYARVQWGRVIAKVEGLRREAYILIQKP